MDAFRTDIYISYYEHNKLPDGTKFDKLISDLRVKFTQSGLRPFIRPPSIFCAPKDVQGHINDECALRLMQTRGGGIALCILSEEYFRDTFCVNQFDCIKSLSNEDLGFYLLPFSLNDSEKKLTRDPFVRRHFRNWSQYTICSLSSTKHACIHTMFNEVCKAWGDAGSSYASRFGLRKFALGREQEDSYRCLQKAFGAEDAAPLCLIFGLDINLSSIDSVFLAAHNRRVLSMNDIDKLKLILGEIPTQRKPLIQGAILAYEAKWLRTDILEWDMGKKSHLINVLSRPISPYTGNNGSALVDQEGMFVPDFRQVPKSPNVILNINSGLTHEGELKHKLLQPEPGNFVVVAGMAGVGKTVALEAVAAHQHIREKFEHGIFYLTLKNESSLSDFVTMIKEILRSTGGIRKSSEILNDQDFDNAIEIARGWFEGKKCLFLIDNVCIVNDITEGKLGQFGDLSAYGESVVVMTTRDLRLKNIRGATCVHFWPRDRYSVDAKRIFLQYCNRTNPPTDVDAYEAFESILRACNGLPFLLEFAGLIVNMIGPLRHTSSEDTVWEDCLMTFFNCLNKLEFSPNCNERMIAEMAETVKSNLEHFASADGSCKLFGSSNGNNRHVKSRLESLCVLQQHHHVKESWFEKFWGLEPQNTGLLERFEQAHLVRIVQQQQREGRFISIHELMLFVFRDMSESGSRKRCSEDLIKSYVPKIQHVERRANGDSLSSRVYKMGYRRFGIKSFRRFGIKSLDKQLLSVSDDGYFFNHFCHLLEETNRPNVLMELMTNPKWIIETFYNFELDQIRSDIGLAFRQVQKLSAEEKRHAISYLKALYDACYFSRIETFSHPETLWSQIYGRLLWLKNNTYMNRFRSKFEIYAPRIWIRPSEGCFAPAGSVARESLKHLGKFHCAQIFQKYLYVCYENQGSLWISIKELNSLGRHVSNWALCSDIENVIRVTFSDTCNCIYLQREIGLRVSESQIVLQEPNEGQPEESSIQQYELPRLDNFDVRSPNVCMATVNTDRGYRTILLVWREGGFLDIFQISGNAQTATTLQDQNYHDHNHTPNCFSITKTGGIIAYARKNNTLGIWRKQGNSWVLDREQQSITYSSGRRPGDIVSLCISDDENLIALGNENGTIRILKKRADQNSWKTSFLEGHSGSVFHVREVYNNFLISAGTDKTVRVWNLRNDGPLFKEDQEWASPSSVVNVTTNGKVVLVATDDGNIGIWKRSKHIWEYSKFEKEMEQVACLGMSDNEIYLVTAGSDNKVYIWKKKNSKWQKETVCENTENIVSVSVSRNGRHVFYGCPSGIVHVCHREGPHWKKTSHRVSVCGGAIKHISLIRRTANNLKWTIRISLESGPNDIVLNSNGSTSKTACIKLELPQKTVQLLDEIKNIVKPKKAMETKYGYLFQLNSISCLVFADIEQNNESETRAEYN